MTASAASHMIGKKRLFPQANFFEEFKDDPEYQELMQHIKVVDEEGKPAKKSRFEGMSKEQKSEAIKRIQAEARARISMKTEKLKA